MILEPYLTGGILQAIDNLFILCYTLLDKKEAYG